MNKVVTVFALFLLTACGLPSLRVGQAKIDPKLAEKPPEQIEAERQGADYIEQKSAAPEPDAMKQLQDIHQVAGPLSASLGEPKKKVTVEDKDAIIASLKKGLLAEQKKAEAWKSFARKYAGKELEGTGVDLAGIGGGFGLLAIIAACIFVPGFGTLVLFVIKRLRGTVQQVAQGVEEYAAEHPEEADNLKKFLSAKMDSAHKAIVQREKQFVDWAAVAARKKTAGQPAT